MFFIALLLIVFTLLMALAVPIGYVMGITASFGLLYMGGTEFLRILVTRYNSGLTGFVLVAVPMFTLAAQFMNRSGVTVLLINFAKNVFGRLRGGLAVVITAVCVVFGILTGSAITETIAVGSILIPNMKKEGYPGAFAAAVTGTASVLGPIIPPSTVMIVLATMIPETSVISLFAAGFLPGFLIAGLIMLIVIFISYRKGYPRGERVAIKEIFKSALKAIIPLMTGIIMLLPILLGITDVTEASAAGAFYALFIGLFYYKTLKIKDIFESAKNASKFLGVIYLLLATASVLGWIITKSGLSTMVSDTITGYSGNPIMILIALNIFLLIVGMFVDTLPAVIILAPILIPPLIRIGFHPLHVSMLLLINLNIGNATPPVGMTLMTASKIAEVSYESTIKQALPFIFCLIIALLILTYFPVIILFVPTLLGLI